MERKYEFTGLEKGGLQQIRRLTDGKVGGWIESERNLSHSDNAWVSDNARVYDNAWVGGEARVYDNARVCGEARVYDNARVYGNAWVGGEARVYGNARVGGEARVGVCGDYWSISGLEHNVTYTRSDNCLAIGCQRRTVEEWARIGDNGEPAPHVEEILRTIFAAVKEQS